MSFAFGDKKSDNSRQKQKEPEKIMSSDYLRSLAKIVLIVVIAGIILNDFGQVIVTYWQTGDKATAVAESAFTSYRQHQSVAVAQNEAQKAAATQGVELESMQVTERESVVQVKATAQNTLWAHRIKSLVPYLTVRVRTTSTAF